MKKIFFGVLLYLTLSLTLSTNAQTIQTVARQAVVPLSVDATNQTIQWEISTDNLAYYPIPGANNTEFNYKASAPAFLRAKLTDTAGKVSYSEAKQIVFEEKTPRKTIKSSGGQAYAETVDGLPTSGVNIQEDRGSDGQLKLTAVSDNWTNQNTCIAWYLYQTNSEYDIDLTLNARFGSVQQFEFSLIDINNEGASPSKSIISIRGTGKDKTYKILNVNIPKEGYYKYVLRPLKDPSDAITVKSFNFHSYSGLPKSIIKTHATNYLSSPSVHLTSWRSTDTSVASGQKYDWAYMEILVPKGGDELSTYYMSLGLLRGYMGIQTNSPTERGVIFSMWDDGDTDTDPTLDQKKRAGAVDWDPKTTVSRFGNEGTGTKSFVHGWNWDTDVPVKFLANARLEAYNDTMKSKVTGLDSIIFRQNTLVSSWFNSGKGWQYISTLRLPNKISYFDSWYSFLENFGHHTGQIKRYAYYYNGFAHEAPSANKTPRWINFNQVNFGNTDGAAEQRVDFEQGQASDQKDKFYMSSGGYGFMKKTTNSIPLQTDKSIVESLDLNLFLARVDQAVAKEKSKNDSIKNITDNLASKNGWTIANFSSQETSGEGTVNGRAATIIDGNNLTYWHSAWQSGIASFPHHITVNMNKTEKITGFLFHLSGGTNRHQKNIELWGSEDGTTFELMLTTQAPDSEQYYIKLPKSWSISQFKLVIKDSHSGEVHCRINEIDVTTEKTTGLSSLLEENAKLLSVFPNPVNDILNFSFGKQAKNIDAVVVDASGKSVFIFPFNDLQAGKPNSISLEKLDAGIYILKLESNGTTLASKRFIKKN